MYIRMKWQLHCHMSNRRRVTCSREMAATKKAKTKTKKRAAQQTSRTKAKRTQPDGASDGRRQRAARSHSAIVDAVYDLVRATGEPPTIDAVAARASVGVRTVFRQFSDLETLHRSINERIDHEVRALLAQPTPDAPSPLAASIARRARVFEHITPFRRAARLARPTSRFLIEQEALVAAVFRAALKDVVGDDVDDDVFEALDLLLSWETWERLRGTQGLDVRQATRVVSVAASTLLGQRSSTLSPGEST